MNQFLQDLESAFRLVRINFYRWDALRENGPIYEQEAENNFSSEIIRHFRNNMEREENKVLYSGLDCHFDVRKARYHIHPDIVLHESADNQNRQILYCEVKVKTNANLTDDLRKLQIAISNNLNFNNAVIIVANKALKEVKDEICNFYKGSNSVDLNKLFLFHGILNSDNTICFTTENFNNIISSQLG
jgi:hypothetical protein